MKCIIDKIKKLIRNIVSKENEIILKKLEAEFKVIKKQNKKINGELVQLRRQVNVMEDMLFSTGYIAPQRNSRIIVSLTSFPSRIWYVSGVINNILKQTLRPDKVVLWLSEDQFPQHEDDLPYSLVEMIGNGIVEIKWCEGDTKAYKKFLPALKEYPNDIIIIIDDDLKYRKDLIEHLYFEHVRNEGAIIASRAHKMLLGPDGKVLPYEEWNKETSDRDCTLEHDLFVTGGSGTLFPPHIFSEEVFNYEVIKKCCPNADDIWINIMASIDNIPKINLATNSKLSYIMGTQKDALYSTNIYENDIQMKKAVEHYSDKLNGIWQMF